MQRCYWVRIALGALAVFAVGMAGIFMYRKGVEKVAAITSSADPINIPMAMLPFQLDGADLGQIERVQIRRDAPKRISGVGLVVKLAGSSAVDLPAACLLTVRDDVDNHGPQFHCATPADSLTDSLTAFGDVRFEPGAQVRSFYLPARVIGEWQNGHSPLVRRSSHPGMEESRTVIRIDPDSGDTLLELQARPDGARLRIKGDSGEVQLRATASGAQLMVRTDTGRRK
jgi:hypothetical protein